MKALYSAGLEIERGAAEGRMTLRPPAADEFHIVMVQQVLDTLADQGRSNAEFVQGLRNDWLIAAQEVGAVTPSPRARGSTAGSTTFDRRARREREDLLEDDAEVHLELLGGDEADVRGAHDVVPADQRDRAGRDRLLVVDVDRGDRRAGRRRAPPRARRARSGRPGWC